MEWMQFIPTDVDGFRFTNISTLAPINGLFQSNNLLNLTTLGMNITIHDARYRLDIQSSNGSIITIITVSQTCAEAVSSALENSSYLFYEYHNNTIYVIPPDSGTEADGLWICVNRGAIVMCSDDDYAFAALKSVVDANSAVFFNNDALKIAYLMTSKGKENFAFSYYTGGTNTYNIDWLMGGVCNSTQLDMRLSYHFKTPEDLNNKYGNFTKTVLSESSAVYTSGNFIIADFTFAYSAVNQVLLSL
jgi:hypothetical protein